MNDNKVDNDLNNSLAQKFYEWVERSIHDLLSRVGKIERDLSEISPVAKDWKEDHDTIMKASGASTMFQKVVAGISAVSLLILSWTASTILDLRDSRNRTEDWQSRMEKTIESRTFTPDGWQQLLSGFNDLQHDMKDVQDAVGTLPALAKQVAVNSALLNHKAAPPQINIRQPPATVIIRDKDNPTARTAPGDGAARRLFGK